MKSNIVTLSESGSIGIPPMREKSFVRPAYRGFEPHLLRKKKSRR